MNRCGWLIALALATLDCTDDASTPPSSSVAEPSPSASNATSSWTVVDAVPRDPTDEEMRAARGHSPRGLLTLLGFPATDVNRLAAVGQVTDVERLNGNFDKDPELESAILVEVRALSEVEREGLNASVLVAFLDGVHGENKKVVKRDEIKIPSVCDFTFEASIQSVHSSELSDIVGKWGADPAPCKRRENFFPFNTGVVVWSLDTPLPRIAHTEEEWWIDQFGPRTSVEISIVGSAPKDIRVVRGAEVLRTLKLKLASGRYE